MVEAGEGARWIKLIGKVVLGGSLAVGVVVVVHGVAGAEEQPKATHADRSRSRRWAP
jgi:hypothetical protein